MRWINTRLLLVAILTAVTIGVTTASGGAQTEQPSPPVAQQATTAPTPVPQCTTVKQYKRAVHRAYDFSAVNGNFVATKPTKKQLEKVESMRSCAKANKPHWYAVERKIWKKRLKRWGFYHYIDVITPYGAWAVPPAIVGCEGGTHGWNRYNNGGSGAAGPYQLLGHGAPMPANTVDKMAQHHEIAHDLYMKSGTGPWRASQGCWS